MISAHSRGYMASLDVPAHPQEQDQHPLWRNPRSWPVPVVEDVCFMICSAVCTAIGNTSALCRVRADAVPDRCCGL